MAKKPKRVKGEHWGRKREDKRYWKQYNEELTVRGEFLLDLDWMESWNQELEAMNKGKRGRPFEFPESLIKLQAVWNQWISLRSIKGLTRKLVEIAKLPKFNDYSTINRRIRQIDTSFALPKHGFCSASTDGSGMKMHQAGEYRQLKYGGQQRRWLKVVITANPLTKDLLDIDVSMEGEGESEPDIAIQHLEQLWNLGIEVDKFWGDGSFDVKKLFNFLEEHGTESAIPPRDNAAKNARGSMRRLREVFEYQTKTWDEWTRDKQYGKRWLGTEGIFS
ncbi:MAG: transposase [Candidatus Nanoarchaeia archaeon]